MSSSANSMKKAAEEPANDEPSSKKAKAAADEQIDTAAANNGTANINKDIGNGTKATTNKTPTKALNGDSSSSNNNNSTKGGKRVHGLEQQDHGKSEDGDDDDDECSDDDEEDSTGLDAGFDPKITQHLEQVESIQIEICNLNEKASEEILKVEQKFNKLRRPHFEKRNELLKEIPNFWLTSLANHPIIAPMIDSPEDEDCLHHMVNLDVEEFEDIKSGYKLKLHFNENPYITNEVIVKEFRLVSSEDVLSSSTPIVYKDSPQGKALKATVDESIAHYRRSRGRNPNQTHHSFFAWLTEPSSSGPDEVAEILKDQIWPNPLEFFFSSPEGGFFGANSGTESSDDEDEEIEGIDDEELDDEEEAVITEGNEYSELDDEDDADEEGEDDDGDDDDEEVGDEEIVE